MRNGGTFTIFSIYANVRCFLFTQIPSTHNSVCHKSAFIYREIRDCPAILEESSEDSIFVYDIFRLYQEYVAKPRNSTEFQLCSLQCISEKFRILVSNSSDVANSMKQISSATIAPTFVRNRGFGT